MLEISINLITVAHVVVSLLMILVILMQRPKQEGLGAAFGSGMTDAAWGARTTDVLQKGTVYLGTLFFLLSLTLGILTSRSNAKKSKDFASDGATQVDTPAGSQDSSESLDLNLDGSTGDFSTGGPEGEENPETSDDPVADPESDETPASSEETPEPEETGDPATGADEEPTNAPVPPNGG